MPTDIESRRARHRRMLRFLDDELVGQAVETCDQASLQVVDADRLSYEIRVRDMVDDTLAVPVDWLTLSDRDRQRTGAAVNAQIQLFHLLGLWADDVESLSVYEALMGAFSFKVARAVSANRSAVNALHGDLVERVAILEQSRADITSPTGGPVRRFAVLSVQADRLAVDGYRDVRDGGPVEPLAPGLYL